MFNNLSKREKIIFWAALAVLLVGFYYFQLLQPMMMERAAVKEQTESLRGQYRAKLVLIQNRLPDLKDQLADVREEYGRQIAYFPKEAEVSKYLFEMEQTASARGIRLEGFSPKAMADRGDFFELPVQLTFFADFAHMVSFVHALEFSAKGVRIVALDAKNSTEPARPGLQVDITVNMYIVKEQT